MADIVERLGKLETYERELAHECDCPPEVTANWAYADTCAEAAAEINRLKAEVERLREALEKVNHGATWGGLSRNKLADIARAALTPSQEPRT
jgi:hypothetical protein